MNVLYEHAPTISLVFFFGFFLWVTYLAYRPSSKKHMQEYAFIPLKEAQHD